MFSPWQPLVALFSLWLELGIFFPPSYLQRAKHSYLPKVDLVDLSFSFKMTTCNLWNLLKWQPVIISHILFLCASDCVVVLQLENWSKKKCLRQKIHHKIAEMTITKVRIAKEDLMALKEWNLHESHCAVHVELRFAVTLYKKWFWQLQTFSLH